jgi:hypothetical protein
VEVEGSRLPGAHPQPGQGPCPPPASLFIGQDSLHQALGTTTVQVVGMQAWAGTD